MKLIEEALRSTNISQSPDGRKVVAVNTAAQQAILNTLPPMSGISTVERQMFCRSQHQAIRNCHLLLL